MASTLHKFKGRLLFMNRPCGRFEAAHPENKRGARALRVIILSQSLVGGAHNVQRLSHLVTAALAP
jgi:hypothetical protein